MASRTQLVSSQTVSQAEQVEIFERLPLTPEQRAAVLKWEESNESRPKVIIPPHLRAEEDRTQVEGHTEEKE